MKYVSELKELENKVFDSVDELKQAEVEVEKKKEAKELAAKQRKLDVEPLNKAHVELNAAKKDYNTRLIEIRKEYNKELIKLKKDFETAVAEEEDKLAQAQGNYDKEFKEFNKKHPEGYHITLKDGDNITTLRRSNSSSEDLDVLGHAMDGLLDSFFRFLI